MIAKWRTASCDANERGGGSYEQGPLSRPLLQIVRLKLGSRSVYGSYRALRPVVTRSGVHHRVVSDVSYAQMKL